MNTHYVQVLSDHGRWIDHLGLWNCADVREAITRVAKHDFEFPHRSYRLIDVRDGVTQIIWCWEDHRLTYEVLVTHAKNWPWTRLEGFDLTPLLKAAVAELSLT